MLSLLYCVIFAFLLVLQPISSATATAAASEDLSRLREEVGRLAQPHLVKDADLRVKIGQSLFSKITEFISKCPADKKTVRFDGASRNGYVWFQGGGFAGCGAFAEVDNGAKDFHISLVLNSCQANCQTGGNISTKIGLGLKASGTVHGHVKGPAGMCSGPSLTYPGGRWSCDCPIGGGVGIKAVHLETQTSGVFDGHMALTPQPDGEISYGLFLTAPKNLQLTVDVVLDKIGKISIPITVDIPQGQIASGKGFGVIRNNGKIKVGEKERAYQLVLQNMAAQTDASGLELRSKVLFKCD